MVGAARDQLVSLFFSTQVLKSTRWMDFRVKNLLLLG
jgi:hypothetical protein